jgi:hypothetical protein
MTRWYRAYAGTIKDDKLAEAAVVAGCSRSVVIATWHAILESAAETAGGGRFDTTSRRVAAALGEPASVIEAVFSAMQEIGLVSGSEIPAWKRRQYESDNSTERSRRHREAARNGNATLQQRCATPPDTETDTEKKETTLKGAGANGLDKLEDQCRQAAGCETSPSPSLFDLSPIRRCLAGGASLEMDVLPTLRAMSARRKPIASWKYAEQAIMDAKASREAPAMAGNVTIPQPRGQPPPAKVSNNRRILDALNAMEPHDVKFTTSHDGPVQISTSRPVLDVLHGRQGRTG